MGTVSPRSHDLGAREGCVLANRGGVGKGALFDDDVVVTIDHIVGAETEVGAFAGSGSVHPRPLVSRERPFLVVGRNDVLTQLRSAAG